MDVSNILKNTIFTKQMWTTPSGYIRILTVKNVQCHKSYKEVGRTGRSKLFLLTRINHQSRTLEDELLITRLLRVLHCYCTWFWIQFAHSPKGSLRNIKAITCFLFPNILTQGKLLVSFRSSCL